MANKKQFNEEVAEKVIDQLKRGTSPFQHPWKAGEGNGVMPMNPTTGKRYKGINTLVLKMEEMEKGYGDNRWLTYNQAKKIGGQVRRGEHGTTIQHWKFQEEQNVLDDQGRLVIGDNGKPKKEIVDLEPPKRYLAKVFNASQIDGMPPNEPRPEQKWEAVERAETILKNSGANIRHDGGDSAFY